MTEMEKVEHAPAPLLPGQSEFEIKPGAEGEAWTASNGYVGLTVLPSERNEAPSKYLGEVPALAFKDVRIRNACTPEAYREIMLIAELNGVFVHVVERGGAISIVVSDQRLHP